MQSVAVNTGVFLALCGAKEERITKKYRTEVTGSDKMVPKTYVYLGNTSPPVLREKKSYV